MLLKDRASSAPLHSDDLQAWNDWKAELVTDSQKEFVRRNPWFSFSKEELFKNLEGKIRVPQVLWQNRGTPGASFSEAFAQIGVRPESLRYFVVKELRGHSSQEVKVIAYDDRLKSFYDSLVGTYLSLEDLDEWLRGKQFLIEESLYTVKEPIPLDFKVYCGEGRARSVLCIDRNHGKPILTYIDPTTGTVIPWSSVFRYPRFSKWVEGPEVSEDRVNRAKFAASFAEDQIKHLSSNDLFISLDLYVLKADEAYTYLGEITPRPGAVHANQLTVDFIKRCLLPAA